MGNIAARKGRKRYAATSRKSFFFSALTCTNYHIDEERATDLNLYPNSGAHGAIARERTPIFRIEQENHPVPRRKI